MSLLKGGRPGKTAQSMAKHISSREGTTQRTRQSLQDYGKAAVTEKFQRKGRFSEQLKSILG